MLAMGGKGVRRVIPNPPQRGGKAFTKSPVFTGKKEKQWVMLTIKKYYAGGRIRIKKSPPTLG